MTATLFNDNWIFTRIGCDSEGEKVDLPHDAMIHEKRSDDALGEHNIGWFEAYDYEYTKTFDVPESWREKTA